MATVLALDHVNIQTVAVAETAQFFADVLALRAGPAFPGGDMTRITWMYDADNRPLVHITLPGMTWAEDRDRPVRPDTGALHHVAFECADHAGMLARLETLGIAARTRDIEAIGLRQVFVHDPNGVLLELNFRGH